MQKIIILPLLLTFFTCLYCTEPVTPPTQPKVLNTNHSLTPTGDDEPDAHIVRKLDFTTNSEEAAEGDVDSLIAFLNAFNFKPEYLFLPPLKNGEQYIISMCPMNSSGDSYHILAYIILALSHNRDIPKVQLTYDVDAVEQILESKMNNYTATQRTIRFAAMLGLHSHFNPPIYIDPSKSAETGKAYERSGYNASQRQHNLIWSLPPFGTHFIDQKALTTLITQHFLQYGRVSTITRLRNGFSQYNHTDNNLVTVVRHAHDEYTRISGKVAPGQPLVIIHARYASTANDTQNIEDGSTKLKNYLEHNGYKVWFIMADGRRQQDSFKTLKNFDRTDVFPHILKKDGLDYGKFYHLHLLLKLTGLPSVKVIGNTSGTLDLAAFLGHYVYNLHVWDQQMNYQCARILMQSTFLTLDLIQGKFLDGLQKDDINWTLRLWLENAHNKPTIQESTKKAAFSKPGIFGYKDLFMIQVLPQGGNEGSLIPLPAFPYVMKAVMGSAAK